MENFMQFSEGEGIAFIVFLLLLLLTPVAVCLIVGRWIWKLLHPAAPRSAPAARGTSDTGK